MSSIDNSSKVVIPTTTPNSTSVKDRINAYETLAKTSVISSNGHAISNKQGEEREVHRTSDVAIPVLSKTTQATSEKLQCAITDAPSHAATVNGGVLDNGLPTSLENSVPDRSTPKVIPQRDRNAPALPTTPRPVTTAIRKKPESLTKESSPLLDPLGRSSSNTPHNKDIELEDFSKKSTNQLQEKPEILATHTLSEKIGKVSNKISNFFTSKSKYVTKGKSVSVFSALHVASYTRASEEQIDSKAWGQKFKVIAKGALRIGSRLLVPITVVNEIGSKLVSNIKQTGSGFVKAGKLVHVKLLTNLAKIDNSSKFSVIKKIGAIGKAGMELVGRSILLSSAAVATSISAVAISVVNGIVLFASGPVSLLGNNRLITQNLTQKIMQKTHNAFILSQRLVNQNLDEKIERANNAKLKMENDKLMAENNVALEAAKTSPKRILITTLKNQLNLLPKNQINEKTINIALESEEAYFRFAKNGMVLAERDLDLQYKGNPTKMVEWSNKKKALIKASEELDGIQNYYKTQIRTLKKEYVDNGLS